MNRWETEAQGSHTLLHHGVILQDKRKSQALLCLLGTQHVALLLFNLNFLGSAEEEGDFLANCILDLKLPFSAPAVGTATVWA